MYKVLIVDDERMIREGMKKVIPWSTLEIGRVMIAASGFEALEIVKEEMPEIMITDISMTEMTGLKLIEKVLEIVPEMRILVLTGYDSFEYARDCLRLHVQDFLLKPIDEEVLSECVRKQVEYLREKERQKEEKSVLLRTEGLNAQMELEKVMSQLIHGRDKEQALKLIEERVNFQKNINLVLAVLLPEQDAGPAKQDSVWRFQQMRNICLSVIDAKGMGITFSEQKDDKIMVALYVEKCNAEANKVIGGLLGILKDEFNYAPRAAIGNEVVGFENLDVSYQDAMELLKNDKMEMHQILNTPNAIRRNRMFREVYEELKNEICTNLDDYPYIIRVFETFRMAAKSYNLSEAAVRKCCFEILADVYWAYISEGRSVKGQSLENFMDSINGADRSVCLELSRQYLTKLLGGRGKGYT